MMDRQSKSIAWLRSVGDYDEPTVKFQRSLFCVFCTQLFPRGAFALVMLWNSAASAQPTSPAAPATAQLSPTRAAPDQHTYSYPSSCDQFLPAGTTHPQTNRVTILSYRLPLTGEFEDISVFRSSGDSNLDQAAIQCAKAIHAPPFKVAGVPTEISWVTGYFWNIPPRRSAFLDVSPAGSGNICDAPIYPPIAVRKRQEGTVIVAYHVGADGSVKDIAVARSSGFPWLDGAAVTCAEFFHYFPATQNGKPIEVDKLLQFVWKLR
jgi:TonB family protein